MWIFALIKESFTGCVEDALKAGDKITLVGFGSFEPKSYPEREGRNPRTKEIVKIAAHGFGVQGWQSPEGQAELNPTTDIR